MKYRSIFSYYGGKAKLASLYPPPKHDTIIEPFAGGAAYSLLYHERQAILNDLDAKTVAIWRYLLQPSAIEMFENHVHIPIQAKGCRISDMCDEECVPGLIYLVQSNANQGIKSSYQMSESIEVYLESNQE